MDELTRLADWMRANGVLELSHQGTTIRFAEGSLPHASPDSVSGAESASESRPPVRRDPGMCRSCGTEPVQKGSVYARAGLCRRCGWNDQTGSSEVTGAPA